LDTDAALKKARYLTLRFLTYRARSKNEVYDYLERKGFSEDVSAEVIKDMENYGYINDERFANDFIIYRKLRGFGLKRVRYELDMKGVNSQVIDQKIAELFNPEEDLERIKEILINRSAGKTCDKNDEKWLKREVSFLKRRGFQDNLIFKALKVCDPVD